MLTTRPRAYAAGFAALGLLLASAALLLAPAGPAAAGDKAGKVPLIPRKALFGNPDKAATRISHDGKYLSYLAPVDGVLNVWVGPADDPSAAKPVTKDRKRGIRIYFWAYTNQDILYLQDAAGDENWHVYRVALKTGD